VEQASHNIAIRPLGEADLHEAGAILRRAFATQFSAPPETFWTDRDFVEGRRMADPSLAFGAWMDGRLVGSSLGANWGSLGVFGPISTHPDTWNRGVARLLIPPVLERLTALGARHLALSTFAESTKHVALYQSFGFWPRFLTTIMTRPVRPNGTIEESILFSSIATSNQAHWLAACRTLTTEVRNGLDVTTEIRTAHINGHGDSVFLVEASQVRAMALCEYGVRSPAGAGTCLIRFAAVRPDLHAERWFGRLIAACDRLAADQGLKQIAACVNASRSAAYRQLLAMGFRAQRNVVTMHRPNEDAFDQSAEFVLEDFR
jgi:GNAT superfamily N-acetyltransferase